MVRALLFKKLPFLMLLLACWGINGQVSLPYTTNFEPNNNTGWSTPGSWTFANSAGNGANATCTGAGSANYYNLAINNANRYLFTPTFTGQAGYTYTVSFCGRGTAVSSNILKIYPATAQTVVGTNETTAYLTGANTVLNTWASETSTAWTCPANGTYCFAFKATTLGVAAMRIDNVTITETAPACVAPGVPTAAAATNTSGTTSFTANWAAGTGTTTDFYLDVATDAGFTSMVSGYNGLVIANAPTTSYNVTGLTEKTTYYYRVRGRNTAGCINATSSSTITTTTACSTPGAPTSTAATTITSTGFTANWTGASGTVTGYLLDVSTASDFSSFVSGFNGLSVGNVLTYAVTGLSSSTPYYYRVRAINTVSCTGTNSGNQNPTTAAACTTPGIPGSVTATGQTTTGLTVNWTAGSGTVTGYQVDVATDSGFLSIVYTNAAIASGATSQAATGLVANTTYYIRVRTLNGGCSSAFTATVTTTTACQAPAAQATSLSFNTVATTSLNGSFTASASATGYLVLRSTSATAPSPAPADGITYTAGDTVGGATVVQAGTGTTFSDSGLTNNTTYYYYIYAYNTGCITTIDYLQASPLTGSQLTTNTKTWYVNKNYDIGVDVWCTAAGSDTNAGTTAAPFATLGKALAVANNGDIIRIDADTYNDDSHSITKSVTIQGASADLTIFDNASGVQRWGSINANNVNISNLTIMKYAIAVDGIAITITGGTGIVFNKMIMYANVGSAGQGAIYVSGASTEVTFNNFSAPCNRIASANYGGAFKINGCKATFNNCSINNNVVSAIYGGGIFIMGANADVTINKCTFDDNSASYGGAIAVQGGTVSINNSCFNNNYTEAASASNTGGGAIAIAPDQATNVSITDCSFANNSTGPASSDGGAITITNLNSTTITVAITSCSFTGNNAADNGEDIYFDSTFSPTFDITLRNNTFNTLYSGTQVNLHNIDMPGAAIKLNALSGSTGGNGDMVANGSGVAVTRPEFTGAYTENTTAIPSSLPNTTCVDRFDGSCGTPSATFACETRNYWGDVSSLTGAIVNTIDTGANTPKTITAATNASSIVFTSTAHGFAVSNWVTITGCTPATYNGNYKITAVTANSFTVVKGSAPGAFSSGGTATKGIPLGWSRAQNPTIYDHAIINYNYNTTTHGNIDACQLTVNTGYILSIDQSNKTDNTQKTTYVNVINSIFNQGTINVSTNGNLIQVNHPLDLNSEAIVTPNINVTKTTGVKYRWDYVYWSKPVSSSVMTNFNTAFDLKYYWDPSFSIDYNRNYLGWRTLSGEPTVGTGFITRVKTAGSNATTPTATTLTMSGTSNNGAITAAIQYYTADHLAFRNFTLLGNPYPGAISFQQFYNDNIDKIYGTCYLWSSKTKYPGTGEYVQADYASFNATGGVGVVTGSPTTTSGVVVPNGYIASGQGFMVRPKVNGTVTFTNGQRTKVIPSNDQFFRPGTENEKDRYWLRITDAGKRFNEQLIGYVAGSTPGFDEAYDGPINSLSPIKFYTFVDKEKLIIQGRGAHKVTDRVALGYSKTTTTPEKFTISVSNAEGIFGSQQPIFLHDKELNVYTNISKRPYEFTGSANTENRFEVVYEVPKPVVKDDKATVTNTIVALGANILSIQAPDTIAQVTLYDISGKVVFEKTTTRFMTTFEAPVSLSTGVYIAKVKLTNNQTVTQKIINK